MIGHVAPEAAVGGPIAAVEEGDIINIEIDKRTIDLEVPADVVKQRLAKWTAPAPKYEPASSRSTSRWLAARPKVQLPRVRRSPRKRNLNK